MAKTFFGVALTISLFTLLCLRTAAETASETASLTIRVENVSNKGGVLQVALYDKSNYEGHNRSPVVATMVEAHAPMTVVKLQSVRPGEYAVKMFQDYYRSGSIVTNMLGIPEEPFGFSNDARPLFDQPSFAETKFNVPGGLIEITVHLQSAL